MSSEWLSYDAIYIRSNQLLSTDEKSLHGKLSDTLHEIAGTRKPKFAVSIFDPIQAGIYNSVVFSQMLPGVGHEEGGFSSLPNVTFSAALVTAAMLRISGGEKVLFVGEAMGDAPRFWAEVCRLCCRIRKSQSCPLLAFMIGATVVAVRSIASLLLASMRKAVFPWSQILCLVRLSSDTHAGGMRCWKQ